MSLDYVGSVVVDGCAEEDDAVHHQTAEDIHLSHVKLTFLHNIGGQRVVDCRSVLGISGAADATVFGGVFFKFCHIILFSFLDGQVTSKEQ